MKRRRHSAEERAALVARYRELHRGASSIADCVRELGVPKATLLRWVQAANATPLPES